MNVFLDTNILIDFLSKRNDYQHALHILRLSVLTNAKLFVSDLTIANCRYILRKDFSLDKFYDSIVRLRKFIHILPIGPQAVDRALMLKANDFEDALQYFSALQAGADCIVTRNVKDFPFAEIEVLAPADFLTKHFPQHTA